MKFGVLAFLVLVNAHRTRTCLLIANSFQEGYAIWHQSRYYMPTFDSSRLPPSSANSDVLKNGWQLSSLYLWVEKKCLLLKGLKYLGILWVPRDQLGLNWDHILRWVPRDLIGSCIKVVSYGPTVGWPMLWQITTIY